MKCECCKIRKATINFQEAYFCEICAYDYWDTHLKEDSYNDFLELNCDKIEE